MIPDFGLGHVLPPFMLGDVVGEFAPRSPYAASMSGLVARFAFTAERAAILRGLLSFREALRGVGFTEGFQWIDGSFVEACEIMRGRPPGDVDVVSVLHRPELHADDDDWQAFVDHYGPTILDQSYCKATYACDAYFIDLDIPAPDVSQQTAYWFGLFSHQRDTFQWKGLVQVDLQSDDAAAAVALEAIESAW